MRLQFFPIIFSLGSEMEFFTHWSNIGQMDLDVFGEVPFPFLYQWGVFRIKKATVGSFPFFGVSSKGDFFQLGFLVGRIVYHEYIFSRGDDTESLDLRRWTTGE